MKWNISIDGKERQVSLDEARLLFQDGQLKAEDFVFEPGGSKWYPASAYATELSKPYAPNSTATPISTNAASHAHAGNSIPNYTFGYFTANLLVVLAVVSVLVGLAYLADSRGIPKDQKAYLGVILITLNCTLAGLGQLIRALLDTARSAKKIENQLSRQ